MPLQSVGTGGWKNELYHSLLLKVIMLHKYWNGRARAPATLVVKTTFLSEHYVCTAVTRKLQFSLQFRNTSFDKLAFDRHEHVGRVIRPALLKTRSLTVTTDLINFIICDLQNLAENWSRAWDVNDRDVDNFRRDETEMRHWYISRPRPQPCYYYYIRLMAFFPGQPG